MLEKHLELKKTNPLNDTLGFDHVFVINLSYRLDRREDMQEIADFLGLDFDFFPAVSRFDRKLLNKYNLTGLSNAQKACYLSHYLIYKEIIKNGYKNALILEDDIDIEFEISRIVSDLSRALPDDWDIFYIAHYNYEKGKILAESGKFRLIESTHPINTHGYAVSARGARKLIKDLDFANPIDIELTMRVHSGFVRSYSIDRTTMIQWKTYDNPSDIPDSGPPFERQELLNSTRRILGYKQRWDYD
ncbi:procollagen galactosyltransferase 2-like [Gigaspora margarita]|uniref:Procollagen galactosyltransferase 2-like n=1 Tax=Gigaspora margarita TaxID=4874 RepID=A0A8H4AA92_GIGMA|nr:procollagen galactosyltransferase 2-like [Gigaspora margarita]